MNVDATIDIEEKKMGMGAVIRNSNGEIIVAIS